MGTMDMSEVIKQRRRELRMSQSDLARAAGIDTRQVRRYEAGDQQPLFSVAVAIADALGITLSELAGKPSHRVNLTGDWWATWQTFRNGQERFATQPVEFRQEGDLIQVSTKQRGLSVEEGGYHWNGEFRLWDNEVLLGWYAANEGSIRSKGTMYFVLHPHGLYMLGRWVGLGYDARIMTGWSSIGPTGEEAEQAARRLSETEGATQGD